MQDEYISINTHEPEAIATLVQRIDPGLRYIKDLHPNAASCRTFLVNDGTTDRILKVRALSGSVWEDTYFLLEIHALKRVAERKLPGVTHLVGNYHHENYHAILKTYAEGTPMNTLDHEALLKDEAFIKKLDRLYLNLHLAGIAKIHFQPRKIVIGDDGELTLVDLSTCIVNTEVGMQIYSQEMREDSRFITRLEKAARQAA